MLRWINQAVSQQRGASLFGLGGELQHRDLGGRGVSLRINYGVESAWTTEIMRRVSSRREALPPTSARTQTH
jgi:hypothetical protein